MRPIRLLPALLVLMCLGFVPTARAQTTAIWSPTAATNLFSVGANWTGGIAPSDGDALLFSDWTTYPDTLPTVKLDADFTAYSLEFDGSYPHYYFDSVAATFPRIYLSNGITVSATGAGKVDFASGGPRIELTASQTWETDGDLSVFSSISGSPYDLTKTGSGSLTLGSGNNYAHLNISAGSVYLAASSTDSDGIVGPAGRGLVTMAAGSNLSPTYYATEIDFHNDLQLAGNVSLGQAGSNAQLHLFGALDGLAPATVTVAGGAVTFDGSTGSNISGVSVNSGAAAIFVSHNSLPATSIIASDGSYVGIAGDFAEGGGHSAADVIAKLNPVTFGGTLGFDDDEANQYGTVNLSAFSNSNFSGLSTLNGGELGFGTTIFAPAAGDHAGVLQLSAFGESTLKVDADLLSAHGVNSVLIGRTDGRGDNGFVVLDGDSDYSGGTTIQSGLLIVSNPDAVGTGAITVNGGTLVINETDVYNPLILTSGKLAGSGYAPNAIIGANFTLSPGFPVNGGRVGQLGFDHLELAGGGTMEWNLQDPTLDPVAGAGTGWDLVNVFTSATLDITATTGSKFTLKLISLDINGALGTATGFVPGQSYSWLIFDTEHIDGFDPASFNLDLSHFVTDAGTIATMSLTQDGDQLYLNFTPVPEPSTYALMALGLAGSGLAAWRKRRQCCRGR